MPWRVIQRGDRRWQVSVAAELRPSVPGWSLVFYFRSPGHQPVWAPTTVTSSSKAEIYRQADKISDDGLRELLDRATTPEGDQA